MGRTSQTKQAGIFEKEALCHSLQKRFQGIDGAISRRGFHQGGEKTRACQVLNLRMTVYMLEPLNLSLKIHCH